MIKSAIFDPEDGISAKVTEDESLLVTMQTFPPDEKQKIVPFRQMLSSDGTPTGSTDMRVLGAITPKYFWISASQDNDRYITRITWLIAGASPKLYQFGTAPRLKADCVLYYSREGGYEEILSPSPLESNFDFVFMCGEAHNGILLVSALTLASDAYMPTMYLDKLMPPFGVKLEKQSLQRLIFKIQDDTNAAGVDAFSATCFGFERTP